MSAPPFVPDPDMLVYLNGLLLKGDDPGADYTFHSEDFGHISWERKIRTNDVVIIVGGDMKKYAYTVMDNTPAGELCVFDPLPTGDRFGNGVIWRGIRDDAPDDLKLWDAKRRLG